MGVTGAFVQRLMEIASHFGILCTAAFVDDCCAATIRSGDKVSTMAMATAQATAASNALARPRALPPSSTEPTRADKSDRFAIANAGDVGAADNRRASPSS